MKKRIDPLTKEEFYPKKVTQRFKCRANQIKYNNRLQSQRRQQLGVTLNPLTKTHRILTKAIGEKDSIKLHKEWLRGSGANMTLLTHMEFINKVQYFALFEFIISKETDYYIIKKNKDYENGNL
jgi:hypothetical protein